MPNFVINIKTTFMKTDRIKINEVNPNAYKPLFELYNNIKKSALSDLEFLLIEIRAS